MQRQNFNAPKPGTGPNPYESALGGGGMNFLRFGARVLGNFNPNARDGGLIGGLGSALGGISDDQNAIRAARLQNLMAQENASVGSESGIRGLGSYTTMTPDQLVKIGELQAKQNSAPILNSLGSGISPNFGEGTLYDVGSLAGPTAEGGRQFQKQRYEADKAQTGAAGISENLGDLERFLTTGEITPGVQQALMANPDSLDKLLNLRETARNNNLTNQGLPALRDAQATNELSQSGEHQAKTNIGIPADAANSNAQAGSHVESAKKTAAETHKINQETGLEASSEYAIPPAVEKTINGMAKDGAPKSAAQLKAAYTSGGSKAYNELLKSPGFLRQNMLETMGMLSKPPTKGKPAGNKKAGPPLPSKKKEVGPDVSKMSPALKKAILEMHGQ
jgi:hypothetical protein